MGKITFKKAVLSDHSVVLKLVREYYEYDGIPWNRKISKGLKNLLETKSLGQVFLLQVDSMVVGYSVLTYGYDYEFGGRLVTITDLYLRNECRRLGIGQRFFDHLSHFCKQKGIRAIELQVEKHNRKAARFYQSVGFETLDRVPLSKLINK